jgi:hypothetical protein
VCNHRGLPLPTVPPINSAARTDYQWVAVRGYQGQHELEDFPAREYRGRFQPLGEAPIELQLTHVTVPFQVEKAARARAARAASPRYTPSGTDTPAR